MKKTDTFFIISNYNTDPGKYLSYCEDYLIYDQSPDLELREKLKSKYEKISFVENTGHNISDYFRFFIDRYDDLPPHMMLAKGNMIGRHISQEFFDRVYANKFYTFLYDDRRYADKLGVAYQLYDGALLEINNSWYALTKVHKYFHNFNDLLTFVFKNPIIPKWVLFSPGACYIISREQVKKYPKVFYENLMDIVSYTYFPSEAYQVERMMHIIFGANYELNEWMLDRDVFKEKIEHATPNYSRLSGVVRRKLDNFGSLYHRTVIRIHEQRQCFRNLWRRG
ncbi:MAG: DUF3431 domain-containing protein [Thiobacillus sp.]|nr:DUF3431 domain-containing protein [Thiobacillus sp.]